ncbi:hypothetical protein SORBI_3010G137333 [Sorghum bicolor]|uniref:CCHC-type domain-containing protein n=1 Tax=Sorghum bicolor TaxID=4558 RepID=A0A1W0VSW2_SORBI|nr:hypothetical protein SORBI_3010G137333 [Sorghum bicolor]
MAAYGLDVECPHSFDGTHFARWRNWMQCNFMFISPQMWWMVDVGFSHVLDEDDLTQAQEKCLDLDIQATNIMYRSLDDCILGEIIDMKTAHEIWVFLNEKYGAISNDDDATSDTTIDTTQCALDGEGDGSCSSHDYDATTSPSTTPHSFMSQGDSKVYDANVVNHVVSYDELVSRLASMTMSLENEKTKSLKLENENSFLKTTCEQQKHLLYVITCSHEELKMAHEELSVAHDNLSSSFGSNDQSCDITNPCDVGKKHVSTSCDDLLSMACSSHIDACSTSMSCETNLLKENNKLNEQVKNLSNKLERCYNSKVTFEHILKTRRNYGDKCGLGFKKKMTKGERKQEKRIKKLHKKKLSHTMCYRCREAGHLANEEERLKHVKCFECHTWGHLTSMCPTKQLVKQQVKPQPKPQVEQKKTPQDQVKINHDGNDLMMMKKKTRRGGRQSRSSKDLSHIKCFECKDDGHFSSRCPTKLEKKAQATLKRQGNEKQHMSKEEKAQSKRSCYLCRERGHMAHSCPRGNSSKTISIDNHNMLRKDGGGTSMVAIAKHPTTHTKAMPKYVVPNLSGPKLVWVPSKSG